MGFDAANKIVGVQEAASRGKLLQASGGKVVFTNGCFDLLHAGHVRYLSQARNMGDLLIVGLNSDQSVRSLDKSPERPLVPEDQRAEVLAGLAAVDLVVIFDESTPAEIIRTIEPDILVKGGDWPVEKIVGAEEVQARGGKVLSIPLVEGLSTTNLVERIRSQAKR
jgi:D-glycero-beta-D-manno-heptose 1-phosphate adenylyltransferase